MDAVWDVLQTIGLSAGLSEAVLLAAFEAVRPGEHIAAQRLGYDSLADANDDGAPFAVLAAAQREAAVFPAMGFAIAPMGTRATTVSSPRPGGLAPPG